MSTSTEDIANMPIPKGGNTPQFLAELRKFCASLYNIGVSNYADVREHYQNWFGPPQTNDPARCYPYSSFTAVKNWAEKGRDPSVLGFHNLNSQKTAIVWSLCLGQRWCLGKNECALLLDDRESSLQSARSPLFCQSSHEKESQPLLKTRERQRSNGGISSSIRLRT